MWSVAEGLEVGKAELRRLFERGTVYADRWTGEIGQLHVPDPLTEVVADALGSKRSVVLAGNAGDGKSHLAQCALDRLPTRSCIEVTSDSPCPTPVPPEAIIFIRDEVAPIPVCKLKCCGSIPTAASPVSTPPAPPLIAAATIPFIQISNCFSSIRFMR